MQRLAEGKAHMSDNGEKAYLKRIGARILSEANDLKRTPEALASELDLSYDAVHAVMQGEASLKDARALAEAVSAAYPVAFTDLWVEADDTVDGAVVMRASDSQASSRIFDRPDRTGSAKPYYEYRDTAMSRNGPFKPEWIEELRLVADNDPDNPDVAYNNGHLMHQLTFFVGPVNFYWQSDGKTHCAELETGDSNYISPFVPHSFASRDPNENGLIIAVTFGAQVRRGVDEFGTLAPETADALAGDLRDAGIFETRLHRLMTEECLDDRALLDGLISGGLSEARAAALLDGAPPLAEECVLLAELLAVQPRDLMTETMDAGGDVVVSYRKQATPRLYPSDNEPTYEIRRLAHHAYQAHVKGFEFTVLSEDGAPLRHPLHQYVYNFGDAPVRFAWGEAQSETLAPGDSTYLRPMVAHSFSRLAGEDEARLAVIRVPGDLTQEAIDEYAGYNPERRSRVILENSRWF